MARNRARFLETIIKMDEFDLHWCIFMAGVLVGGVFIAFVLTYFHDDVPW